MKRALNWAGFIVSMLVLAWIVGWRQPVNWVVAAIPVAAIAVMNFSVIVRRW